MSFPSLVIFDCDGVLVDTETVVNTVLVENLARYGLHLTVADCVSMFVGGTVASIAKRVHGMGYPIPSHWPEDVYSEMFTRLRQGVEMVPGVWQLLDRLDAEAIPYCIGSNGPIEKMEITLKPSGLWQRFQGRIFSPHVIGMEHAKPSPGLFLHAANAMNVPPEHAVVIEDSTGGVTAAISAGMRCYGYCAETPRENLLQAGAMPFDEMAQMPILLGLKG